MWCVAIVHSFWLAVRINTGLGMGLLYSHPIITLWSHWSSVFIGWPIGAIYSGGWITIKEDPEKGIGWLKASSADRRLEALATLFSPLPLYPESSTWPFLPKLIYSSDSSLTVLASQLITSYSKLKLLVIVVHDFFNHCIMNKCCYC